jgi:hypothetical protein
VDGLEASSTFSFRQDLNPVQPDLSVIIVSYNVKAQLQRCLCCLQPNPEFLEIVVVDNNSGDGSQQMLKENFPQIKTIFNGNNLGFSRAANQGIEIASANYILLLNPDTQVDLASLKAMVELLEKNQSVGILGPRIVDSSGKRQYSARNLPSLATSFAAHDSFLNRILPGNPWSEKYLGKKLNVDQASEVDWVSGSCMLIRRKVFDSIGLLDDRFYMFVEDVDFCRRAKTAGWKVVYLPSAKIVHQAGQSVRQRKIKMLAEHHKSMYYYFRKYYGSAKFTRPVVFLGVWLRLGTSVLGHWLRH